MCDYISGRKKLELYSGATKLGNLDRNSSKNRNFRLKYSVYFSRDAACLVAISTVYQEIKV